METVAQLTTAELSPDIIESTMLAFMPLLKEHAKIEEIPRSTFRYGATDRHQLDVYYPIKHDGESSKTRVLVYIYGGGFVSGERQLPEPFNLAYGCVGAYFARRGFVTVIPDYRLAPNATFPGPAEDVRDAVLWISEHPEALTSTHSPNPDTEAITLIGHSAGANHVISALSLETEKSTRLRTMVTKAVLGGGVFHTHPTDPYAGIIGQYYGNWEKVEEYNPLSLVRRASDQIISALPRLALFAGEREPGWLVESEAGFRPVLEARTGRETKKIVAKGHNHISVNCALGTGKGEEWAEEVIEWIDGESK